MLIAYLYALSAHSLRIFDSKDLLGTAVETALGEAKLTDICERTPQTDAVFEQIGAYHHAGKQRITHKAAVWQAGGLSGFCVIFTRIYGIIPANIPLKAACKLLGAERKAVRQADGSIMLKHYFAAEQAKLLPAHISRTSAVSVHTRSVGRQAEDDPFAADIVGCVEKTVAHFGSDVISRADAGIQPFEALWEL